MVDRRQIERAVKGNRESEWALEYVEALKTLTILNKRGVFMLVLFSLITIVSKIFFKLPIPWGIVIIIIFFTVVISLYVYLLNRFLGKGEVNLSGVENLSFGYFITNIILYSVIVHYTGGLEWIGIFIFFFAVVEANILLPPKKGAVITSLAFLGYLMVGLLEYCEIIPHYIFITTSTGLYKNTLYFLITVGGGAGFGFHYVGFITRLFAKMFRSISSTLRDERQEMMKAQAQLKESKDTLEVRVRARTEELEEITKHLEEQVRIRTRELQDKLGELEKFQKFAVGREVTMVELKRKIEKLEKGQ